jgi:hypothetical protein
MEGAQERFKAARAMVWWGAMMPLMKEPPSYEKFTGYVPDKREQLRRWLAAWDRVDAGLRRSRKNV